MKIYFYWFTPVNIYYIYKDKSCENITQYKLLPLPHKLLSICIPSEKPKSVIYCRVCVQSDCLLRHYKNPLCSSAFLNMLAFGCTYSGEKSREIFFIVGWISSSISRRKYATKTKAKLTYKMGLSTINHFFRYDYNDTCENQGSSRHGVFQISPYPRGHFGLDSVHNLNKL